MVQYPEVLFVGQPPPSTFDPLPALEDLWHYFPCDGVAQLDIDLLLADPFCPAPDQASAPGATARQPAAGWMPAQPEGCHDAATICPSNSVLAVGMPVDSVALSTHDMRSHPPSHRAPARRLSRTHGGTHGNVHAAVHMPDIRQQPGPLPAPKPLLPGTSWPVSPGCRVGDGSPRVGGFATAEPCRETGVPRFADAPGFQDAAPPGNTGKPMEPGEASSPANSSTLTGEHEPRRWEDIAPALFSPQLLAVGADGPSLQAQRSDNHRSTVTAVAAKRPKARAGSRGTQLYVAHRQTFKKLEGRVQELERLLRAAEHAVQHLRQELTGSEMEAQVMKGAVRALLQRA